jgi:hypothetical protein
MTATILDPCRACADLPNLAAESLKTNTLYDDRSRPAH